MEGVFTLLFALYGWSAIPTAYLFSFFGTTDVFPVSIYVAINMVFSFVLPLAMYIEGIKPYGFIANTRDTGYMLDLYPHFAVAYTLLHFSKQAIQNNQCKSVSCKENVGFCCQVFNQHPSRYVKPYLAFPSKENPNGLLTEVLLLAFDGFLYFSFIAFLDYKVLAKTYQAVLRKCLAINYESMEELDEDVAEEQNYVLEKLEGEESTPNNRDDVMLVGDLAKTYIIKVTALHAVKGISFGVMKGECFGLLGSNGAGKTTIFKMLTGDEIPLRGDAKIVNYTLRKHKKKFLRQIGYCPQFDALNELLTGRQILQLYVDLKGIPKKYARQEVNKWIALLGLQQYEQQQTGSYSGGTKRKLSTALALIANPTILFLDEPTSGIDPVSRRSLWSILDKKQKSGQSIVLTSHSMDECEALCGRLAIMVAGEFVCIGPIPHLKQKFSQGFTIQIKLNVTSDYENQVKELKRNFQEQQLFVHKCELEDEHLGLLHYNIKNPDILWSQIFKTMEDLKNAHSIIQDYIVTESTLEQVFLYFAKQEAEQEFRRAEN